MTSFGTAFIIITLRKVLRISVITFMGSPLLLVVGKYFQEYFLIYWTTWHHIYYTSLSAGFIQIVIQQIWSLLLGRFQKNAENNILTFPVFHWSYESFRHRQSESPVVYTSEVRLTREIHKAHLFFTWQYMKAWACINGKLLDSKLAWRLFSTRAFCNFLCSSSKTKSNVSVYICCRISQNLFNIH